MEILKANEIRGYTHYTKSKLIDFLIKRGLIPEKYDTNKDVKPKPIIYKQIQRRIGKCLRLMAAILDRREPTAAVQIARLYGCLS